MNNYLLPILSCEKLQELDAYTIENIGIPQEALMEEAAERVFATMCADFPEILTSKVLVFCGRANNGADSLCVARKLFNAGAKVAVCAAAFSGSDLFMRHLAVCKNIGMDIKTFEDEPDESFFDFVIDGIFGVGYKYDPQRSFPLPQKWRDMTNNATVLAVDVPSGLAVGNSDVIAADVTYSIGYPKNIFYNVQTRAYCGKIRNVEISFDKKKIGTASVNLAISTKDVEYCRSNFVHKYKRGSCLIIGGSPGKNGATSYSASAAFAAGCGIVAVLTGKANFPDICIKKEAVYDVIENIELYKHYSVALIGPGLAALNNNEKSAIEDFICNFDGRLIFDASFFTVFSKDILKKCRNVPLLTPHSGEFRKFFDTTEISIEKTCELAKEYGCNILLKDAFIIAAMHDGTATVFDFPNRIAAQAGSGDLLAGYIAGNLLQINDYYDAIFISIMRFYRELEKFADRNCYLPDELILNLSFSEKQKIRV